MAEHSSKRLVRQFDSHSALLDPSTSWYRRWYFLQCLSEELEKSRRHQERPTAVITIGLPLAAESLVTSVSDCLRERLASIAGEALRPGDFPGTLTDDELAVFLPGTDRHGAEAVVDRLRERLAAFSPWLGLAVYPEDGLNARELVHAASFHAMKCAAQLIDFQDYRKRLETLNAV
jgi:GGDEF domain-containing protein